MLNLVILSRFVQKPLLTILVVFIRMLVLGSLYFTYNTEYHLFLPRNADIHYDFVVVGSGSGGGVVGSRLAEIDKFKVLILEAGDLPYPDTYVPGFFWLNYITEANWGYSTAPQKHSMFAYKGNSNLFPRGKLLGGCSSMNFLMYIRGNKNDYDNWSNLGNQGWDYQTVLKYFKKSENYKGIVTSQNVGFHGVGGPLSVERQTHVTGVSAAFMSAGLELGYKILDTNTDKQQGFQIPDITTNNGRRASVAEAFIKPNIKRKNFHVLTKAFVTQIIFDDNNRAIGVKYVHRGIMKVVYATREVILSAGAVDSPKLLMLSGIGPKEHLQSLNIPVRLDLPGVGQNFHDQPVIFGLPFLVNKGLPLTFWDMLNPWNLIQYKLFQTGPYSTPFSVDVNAWAQISGGDNDWPDLQVLLMTTSAHFDYGFIISDAIGYSKTFFFDYFKPLFGKSVFSMGPTLLRPKSRGSITLQSRNAFDQAIIDPNFLEHPDDVDFFVRAIKFCLMLSKTKSMTDVGTKFHDKAILGCKHLVKESDDYWRCYARQLVSTIYHPGGSCKMAPETDPMGVVDNRLSVRGIKGLRVVDASIMPQVISGNTNAPTIMIGERAADFIKQDHGIIIIPPT